MTIAAVNERAFDGTGAGIGHGTPGSSIVEKLNEIITDVNAVVTNAALAQTDVDAIQSGQATIPNGSTTVAVTVGAAYNGKKAVVSFGEAPTSAVLVYSLDVAAGDLVIGINADNTADLKVNYIIDLR